MALDSKKVACSLKNGIVVLSIFCYRFSCAHPIVSSLLCSFGLLYVVYPEVFFFLVSSSPVLISTALLLGALLSLGQPHIPQIDDIEEEEENAEASSKSNEDVNEEKKNKAKETTDKDDVTENLKGKTSAVKEVTVTKVSRRRFEEGIDDFSTRRYLDPDSVLGKRTEIVETIEEEEEQSNGEELENDRDHIGCDVVGQRGGLMSILKEEEEKGVEIKNKAAAAASVDVPSHVIEADAHKEEENIVVVEDVINAPLNASETDVHEKEENIVLVEDTPEKFQEKTTHEVVERQGILSMDKGEDIQMENHPISVHLSYTDTLMEGSHQKPVKVIAQIEEEMPLINHTSPSSLELHEEISHSRIVDPDFAEGFLKSKCSVDDVQAEISNEEAEGAQEPPVDESFSLSLQSSWKKFAHHHTYSDSGSDHAESSSADASLGDLGPMFDELHPLLDFEAPKTGSVSGSSLGESEIIHEEDFSPRERTSEDLIVFPDEHQAQSDGHEEEEEEENVPADFGFTWTEDDEKNLRDLGYSERERVQLEEKVIALRHAQHRQEVQEANLMDFFSEERPSLLEEEGLVEIGFLAHKNVKNATENQSDSADGVQSDSGHKDIPIEIRSDSVDEEKLKESTEEKSSGVHVMEQIHRDFLLQEDQSRGPETACPSKILQEETDIQVSSIESTMQNFTEEGLASKQEEPQAGSPKAYLKSIETIGLAELNSPTVIDMQRESLPDIVNAASIEGGKSKTEESEETSDHSSSTLSSNKIESTTVEATAGELTRKHREFCLGFPEDSEQYLEMVEAIEPDTPATEISRDSVLAAAEGASTEEHQLKEKKTEEASESTGEIISEDSTIKHHEIQVGFLKASLESTPRADAVDLHSPPVIEMQRHSVPAVAEVALIKREESDEQRIEELSDDSISEPRMREFMAVESACRHEEDLSDTPKILQKESAPAVAEDGSTEEQYLKEDKIEGPFDDSSSSASEKFESILKDDVVVEEPTGKNEEIQGGSTKASEKPTDLDSDPVLEMHGDSVPTFEEEAPTEARELRLEGTEESHDGSESQQKLILLEAMSEEEVESAIKDVIAKGLVSGHEEVRVGSPKVSLESAEVTEPVELDSPPEIQMTRDSARTGADVDSTEKQQSNMEETKESSDDSNSSASDISRLESPQELTFFEAKFKEEILSAFNEAIAEESTSRQQSNMEEETKKSSDDSISSASDISMAESLEELTIPEEKSKEEILAAFKEAIAEESTSKHAIILSGFKEAIAEESTSRQQSKTEETKKLPDDSSSSASDISMAESLQGLTILEVKSKEGILAAFKEAIAEESTSKHEGIQVGSSQVSEHFADTVVEPLNLESSPGIEMHRDILPVVLEVASTEESQSKPERTEQPSLNVRHSSSCGGDIP